MVEHEHLRQRQQDLGHDEGHDRDFESRRAIGFDDVGQGARGLDDDVEFAL